jgi:hypothetical protein
VIVQNTLECPLITIEEGNIFYKCKVSSKTKEITEWGTEIAGVYFSDEYSKTSLSDYSANIGGVMIPTPECPLLTL